MIARFSVILMLAAIGPASSETPSVGILAIETDSKSLNFRIEIADEPAERSRGLMFRDSLGDREGMLFVYPTPRIASFWMKNTEIPLDMLFIDKDGMIVSIASETTPFSLKPVISGEPVVSVLEIFGGLSADLGIEVGDTVSWTANSDEK